MNSTSRITRDQATVYRPEAVTGGAEVLPNDPKFRADPWVMVWYPWAWTWHPEHGFVPDIGRLPIKAGTNGVTGRPGQRPNPQQMFGSVMAKGGRIFKPGDGRLGKWKDYLISYKADRGGQIGKHFCWMGDEFEKSARGTARQRNNSPLWWEFVVWFRDHSPAREAMPEETYNGLLSRERRRLRRMEKGQRLPELIESQAAKVKAMQDQWAKMEGFDASEATVLAGASTVASGDIFVDSEPVAPAKKRTIKKVK